MRGVNDWKCWSCQSKLTTRYEGRVCSSVYWETSSIEEFKCICGCLLYIKQPVVELLHPCRECDWERDKLSCPECLAIAKSVSCDGNHNRKCRSDRLGSELSGSEMAKT